MYVSFLPLFLMQNILQTMITAEERFCRMKVEKHAA